MRNYRKHIIVSFLLSFLISQDDIYRTVDDVKDEWTGYTSFQKEEMISFCDFLFNEGYYERCLLTSFRILYKFPHDPMVPTIHYYIARCYEEMDNYSLAHKYYRKVKEIDEQGSVAYKAAYYRDYYVNLLADELNQLLKETENIDDPYLMTFRGYAYLKEHKWEKARTSFINAQEKFELQYYDDLMIPLYKLIENVNTVPSHNKYLVFATSILFPGGGQFMLKEWKDGQGILSSVGLMMLIGSWAVVDRLAGEKRFMDNESTFIPLYNNFDHNNHELKNQDKIPSELNFSNSSIEYLIPPLIIGSSIFLSSSLKSFKDTEKKNKKLIEYYINDGINLASPARFLDFKEPSLILSK